MSEIKSMEHATLKVPYEVLNKKFRVAQKALDREVDQMHNVTKEVEKVIENGSVTTVSKMTELVKDVIDRLQVLKRKATENISDELNAGYICKRKLNHLKGAEAPEIQSSYQLWQASVDHWKRIRMDRMVIEHFLRMGYYESAEQLANTTNIKHLTNMDIFQTSREVEKDLASFKTTKCALWCNDNKSKLRKINSKIEFQLRVQDFVELVRSNSRVDAIKLAQKYFPSFVITQPDEISRCMGLLARQPDTKIERYKGYFGLDRWSTLIQNFRNENYRLFQLSSQSLLSIAVQAGLSSLKTPQCYSPNCTNLNCPVCQEDFNNIAKQLPFSHCVQSRLICRVTGIPLNEHNLPMMLPNGQIFGQLAFPSIKDENGTIICPITKTKFSNPKIEKVFVM